MLNSVLSIERTGAYPGVSGFNFQLKSLGPAAALLLLVVFRVLCFVLPGPVPTHFTVVDIVLLLLVGMILQFIRGPI